jgi:uncharacterized protein DUF2510
MAVERRGWRPDPYGVHEQRYFSLDGRPTRLVSDGGKTSYDPPPIGGGTDMAVLPTSLHVSPPGRRVDSSGGSATPAARSDVRADPDHSRHSGRTATGSVGLAPVEPMAVRAMPSLLVQPTHEEVVHHVAAGWYPDPTTHSELRYWDGARWTEHSSPATPPNEPAPSPPVVRSRLSARTSSALVNIGLLLVAGALIFALVVTGNPRLPSDPDSAAQGNSAETTTTTLAGNPPTAAAKAVAAWSAQYEGNMKDLGTDEENIDVADDELKASRGGDAAHNFSTALAAAQQLSSDVATDQKLPAIPDGVAESYWTTELSDLAVAAGAYFQGFTDSSNGNPTAGAALIEQGAGQVRQAQIRGNDLVSRLSAAGSG